MCIIESSRCYDVTRMRIGEFKMATHSFAEEDLVTLLPLENSTSVVWKHFGFPSRDEKMIEPDKKKRKRVFCKLCKRDYSYVGNTTNLWQHLEECHVETYREAKEEAKQASEKESSSSTTATSVSMASSDQPTIDLVIARKQPYPRNSARLKVLNDAVCYFISRDMHPYQTVNDTGFRAMLAAFDPRYVPMDRKTLATNYIPKLYDKERERICGELCSSEISSYALTTDVWTSRHNEAYTGVTVHFVAKSFQLKAYLLETVEFPVAHTGVNIAAELQLVLDNWKLPEDNLSAVTTDNGSNIVAAFDITRWLRMPCFSHTLQLAVEVVLKLPEVSRALARSRQLISHFNRSSKSTYLFKQKQISLQHKQLSLVQDVSTRWNSAYYMAERLLSQQQPLCATLLELHRGDLMPSDTEFKTLELFVKVMEPLVEITESIGAQKWVTISAVRPVLYKLLEVYFRPKEGERITQLEKTMKTVMRANLADRYKGSVLKLLNKAAFLDPRFKALSFLPDDDRLDVIASIEAETVMVAQNIASKDTESAVSSSAESAEATEELDLPLSKRCKVSKAEKRLLSFVDDIVKSKHRGTSPAEKAKAEIHKYVDEEPEAESPLVWWRMNSARYPCLSYVARKYLAIPATSVPAERAFSLAGHIVNQKRSALLSDNVNKLVFLAENLP